MTVLHDALTGAVKALRAVGHTVEPWSNGYPLWLVDGETFTDGAVLVLAMRLGLMDATDTLQ